MNDQPETTKEKDDELKPVSTALPNKLFSLAEAEAKREDRTIAAQIRRIVAQYYEKAF